MASPKSEKNTVTNSLGIDLLLKLGDKMRRFKESKSLNKQISTTGFFLLNGRLLEVAMVLEITAVVALQLQKTNCVRYFQ